LKENIIVTVNYRESFNGTPLFPTFSMNGCFDCHWDRESLPCSRSPTIIPDKRFSMHAATNVFHCVVLQAVLYIKGA